MKSILLFFTTAMLVISTAVLPLSVSAQSSSVPYVALGDSVAAGAGLPTDGSADNQLCGRSSESYPYSFAASLNMRFLHLACSGAKANEGIYKPQEAGNNTIPEQLDSAFSYGTPEVMSITIGANDVRWTEFMRQCLSTVNCANRTTTASSTALLTDLRAELNWIMYRIHHHSDGNPPTVLLNGYYSPFSGIECNDALNMTASEQRWLDQRISRLNRAISTIADKYSYVHFVSTDFTGHGLCSGEPWVQGLQDPAPFHPTAAGQRAIADANIDAYSQTQSTQPPAASSKREKLFNYFQQYKQRYYSNR